MRVNLGLVLTILLSMAGPGLFAQDGPPPPLIWRAPEPSEIKRFVSTTHKFSIDFIGEPKASGAAGPGMSYYVVQRPGSLMTVRVIEFTKEELEKHSTADILSQIESVYGTTKNYEIVGQTTQNAELIDFASTDKQHFRRVKARFVNGTLYELYIDVTNWHILQPHYPDKTKAFMEEADRFFKSFAIIK
jgi:hypothetical protein